MVAKKRWGSSNSVLSKTWPGIGTDHEQRKKILERNLTKSFCSRRKETILQLP